jgi:hypothetical protein
VHQNSSAQIRFRDQLTNGEIAASYQNGQEGEFVSILESLGGGVAVVDYDLDSRDDLCFAGGGWLKSPGIIGGHTTTLFRNQGHWQFRAVTDPANLQCQRHYSHGVIASDYDADGFTDILITGYGGLTLWKNQGDGTFDEMTVEQQRRMG